MALSFQTDKYKLFMYAAGNFGFKTTQLEIWIKYSTNLIQRSAKGLRKWVR